MAIIQNANGKYEVRVTVTISGKLIERRKRGISTKGEARRIAEELKNDLINLRKKGWVKIITWGDSIEAFIAWKEKKVAYSTLVSAKGVLKLHTSLWNDRPIDGFKTFEIENLIENAFDAHAIESKRKLLSYIKDVFKRQIQLGNIILNPCADLSYSKAPEKELIAMNREEIKLLLGKARVSNHPWYSVWRVTYELGLRSGEGLALRWTDIDFATNRVSINKSFCSKLKQDGPTKNRKTRTIPMNSELANFFKKLKIENVRSEFALPQLPEWRRGEAAKILRTFQLDLGIRQTNFHSLRASFITHLLLSGTPVTVVQMMVGHADLKTTQRYVRMIGSDLDGATDSLALDFNLSDVTPIASIFKDT